MDLMVVTSLPGLVIRCLELTGWFGPPRLFKVPHRRDTTHTLFNIADPVIIYGVWTCEALGGWPVNQLAELPNVMRHSRPCFCASAKPPKRHDEQQDAAGWTDKEIKAVCTHE